MAPSQPPASPAVIDTGGGTRPAQVRHVLGDRRDQLPQIDGRLDVVRVSISTWFGLLLTKSTGQRRPDVCLVAAWFRLSRKTYGVP